MLKLTTLFGSILTSLGTILGAFGDNFGRFWPPKGVVTIEPSLFFLSAITKMTPKMQKPDLGPLGGPFRDPLGSFWDPPGPILGAFWSLWVSFLSDVGDITSSQPQATINQQKTATNQQLTTNNLGGQTAHTCFQLHQQPSTNIQQVVQVLRLRLPLKIQLHQQPSTNIQQVTTNKT